MGGKYDGWVIKVEMSEYGIFGPEGTDEYNVDWSLDNLMWAIHDKLTAEYPGAEIVINLHSINDMDVVVDSDGDIDEEHGLCVNGFVIQIWQGGVWADWAIERS